jgi:hypothetical protein
MRWGAIICCWWVQAGLPRPVTAALTGNGFTTIQITIATTQGIAFNLNDAAWSVIPSGWTLVTAEDVNSNEWIVGLGTDSSGQSRGYVSWCRRE